LSRIEATARDGPFFEEISDADRDDAGPGERTEDRPGVAPGRAVAGRGHRCRFDEEIEKGSEYVLVPRVPTREMLDAAWADALAEDAAGVWAEMIGVAERLCP
jgi:hypothetical protein